MKKVQQLNDETKKQETPIMVQIMILAGICLIGEILAAIIPINCSSPVYDFVLVFLLLQFKVIHLQWIEKISNILASCMLLAFVPGTISIVNETKQLLQIVFPAFLAATIGSVFVLVVSGWTVQLLIVAIKKIKQKGEA